MVEMAECTRSAETPPATPSRLFHCDHRLVDLVEGGGCRLGGFGVGHVGHKGLVIGLLLVCERLASRPDCLLGCLVDQLSVLIPPTRSHDGLGEGGEPLQERLKIVEQAECTLLDRLLAGGIGRGFVLVLAAGGGFIYGVCLSLLLGRKGFHLLLGRNPLQSLREDVWLLCQVLGGRIRDPLPLPSSKPFFFASSAVSLIRLDRRVCDPFDRRYVGLELPAVLEIAAADRGRLAGADELIVGIVDALLQGTAGQDCVCPTQVASGGGVRVDSRCRRVKPSQGLAPAASSSSTLLKRSDPVLLLDVELVNSLAGVLRLLEIALQRCLLPRQDLGVPLVDSLDLLELGELVVVQLVDRADLTEVLEVAVGVGRVGGFVEDALRLGERLVVPFLVATLGCRGSSPG